MSEERFLQENIKHVFKQKKDCSSVFVVSNTFTNFKTCLGTHLYSNGKCAQDNRIFGLQYIENTGLYNYVLCIDSDMLVDQENHFYNLSLDGGFDICTFNRFDYLNGVFNRQIKLKIVKNKPVQLFGSFLIRPSLWRHMIPTKDFEEQWFLLGLLISDARFLHLDRVLIHHYDSNTYLTKIRRFLFSSRGVGYWQGFFYYLLRFSLVRVDRFFMHFVIFNISIVLAYFYPIFLIICLPFFKKWYYLVKGGLFYVENFIKASK